jgi:hypothetical protein
LRTVCAAIALSTLLGSGVASAHEAIPLSCAESIGKPISAPMAVLGPPRAVYRISETALGYVFETRETAYIGGEPYYTVNYLTGADRHHTPVQRVTRACTGVFVVRAPLDAIPMSQQIIVDVIR